MGMKRALTALGGFAAASLMGSAPLAAHATGRMQTYGANVNSHYELSVDRAYQLDRNLPQGCKCKESGVSPKNCDLFECDCTCDLTAGMCDWNCCCDKECTDDQRERFEGEDACLPEGAASNTITQCYNENQLETINPRYPMTPDMDSTVDQMMCVVYDNSDVKGVFYDNPPLYEKEQFDDDTKSRRKKEYEYADYVTLSTTTTTTESEFDLGVSMPAARKSGDGMTAAYGGFFPMPTSGPDGQCVESSYAAFMTPVRTPHSCFRVSSDLKSDCETMFDWERFSSDLWVGASPKSSPAATGGTEDWVKVTMSSLVYVDPDTGESTSMLTDSSPRNITSFSSGVCRNALSSVAYTVTASSGNKITSVAADVTVTDITNTSATTDSTLPTIVAQEFTLEFEAESLNRKEGMARNLGNAVNRSRSGNPGYLSGLPLLSATKNLQADTMYARIPGLQVMGSMTDGQCPHVNSTFSTQTVNFGQDMMSGCTLSFTKAELEDMCENPSTSSYFTTIEQSDKTASHVPIYLSFNDTHVGKFGNADPLDRTQWLEMYVGGSFGTDPSWDSSTKTCSHFISSANYKFLVAHVGSTDNPQAKIVGAQLEYETTKIRFAAEDSDTQSVLFSTTVSFVTLKGEDYSTYAPPAPPILFTMPYDVFYPFNINAASGAPVSAAVVGLLVVLCSVALMAV